MHKKPRLLVWSKIKHLFKYLWIKWNFFKGVFQQMFFLSQTCIYSDLLNFKTFCWLYIKCISCYLIWKITTSFTSVSFKMQYFLKCASDNRIAEFRRHISKTVEITRKHFYCNSIDPKPWFELLRCQKLETLVELPGYQKLESE